MAVSWKVRQRTIGPDRRVVLKVAIELLTSGST